MTAEKTTTTADAVRNLIVCDTQFGWNGETTLKLPELLDLQARGWLIEGDENNEFSLTTAGEAVVAQALRQAESIGAYPLAWLIVWNDLNATTGEAAERTSVHRHNAVADYRAVDPDARVFPLYAALPAPRADFSPTATRKLDDLAGQGYVTNGVAIFNPATGQRGLVDNLGYVGWQGPQAVGVAPRPMVTAPRDGTLLRLLVDFDEHAIDDTIGPTWTIGSCNLENDPDAEWQIVGWCWTHDHFTEGKGEPVGWLPLIDAQPESNQGVDRG